MTRYGRATASGAVMAMGLLGITAPSAQAASGTPYPRVNQVKPKDETVKAGEKIKVTVKAENSANRASRRISLVFVLSRSASPSGAKRLLSTKLPTIPADDDVKPTYTVTIPHTTAVGAYQLLVTHPRKDQSPSVLGAITVKVKPGKDSQDDGGATPTPPGSSSGTPSRVLNLANWKLTLPIGPAADDADEIKQPALGSYANPTYFHVNGAGNGVVFRAHAGGATTSGSSYPRSELREMTDSGKKEASWSSKSGTHVLTLTAAITAEPSVKPHVVAAQIHGDDDDIVMVRLEKNRLFVEADGDEVGLLDAAYVLGTPFTVELRATSAGIQVTYNGAKTVTYAKSGSGYYFKAGCYTQSNTDRGDKASAYGEVVVYALKVVHNP